MDQKEFYLAVYQDYREHARHSESTRETANNFMLAISAAIITVMINDHKFCPSDIPLGISLIVFGILGLLSSFAYTDRYQRNRMRASKIKKALDEYYNNKVELKSLEKLKEIADDQYNQLRYNIFSIIGLFKPKDSQTQQEKDNSKKAVVEESIKGAGHHIVWFLFPSVLIIVGIIFIILAILPNSEC